MRCLLISGLTLAKPNSFARQLRLLARQLSERHQVSLVGRGPGAEDLIRADTPEVRSLVEAQRIDAVLLLGYPDQFPFIAVKNPDGLKMPVYLWAQLSRPVSGDIWGLARPVALTRMTAAHLQTAGVQAPIIPHGVDTAMFRPGGERPTGAPLLGTVGANTRRKRFDRLLEALSLIRDLEWFLEIKTDGANKPGGFDLPDLVARYDLEDRVRVITGDLSDEEMAVFYRRLALYIHTAEWEGFGIPVVEAMACGVPVVCSPTQGPGELVPYSDLLVEKGQIVHEGESRLFWVDPPALAETVRRGLTDEALRRRLTAQGRMSAAAFDIRGVVDRWITLLKEARGRAHDSPS